MSTLYNNSENKLSGPTPMSPAVFIPLKLSDGSVIRIEATPIGEQKVSGRTYDFKDAISQIKSIAHDISETIREIREDSQPEKISIKFGLEIAVESGQLTSVVVKGSVKTNIEVTLEWSKS